MKKLLVAILLLASTATVAQAAIKVIGKGADMRLDTSSFAPEVMANYDIFRVKCLKCHSLERIVVAIQTGVSPISGQPFDRAAAKAYGTRMHKKPESRMSKTDAHAAISFLNYLFVQTER